MPPPNEFRFSDLQFLHHASARLLGYFVHTWYNHYLNVIEGNYDRWRERGIIRDLAEPTELGAYSLLFDFAALNTEKLTYIIGIYLYILACHKGVNHRLMNRLDGKQVLYLRGYDFEGSLDVGGNMAMGFSSVDSSRFNGTLAKLLAQQFALFKVLSPKDVFYETAVAQSYFYGNFDRVIKLAMNPFSSIYLNALSWKEGVLNLLDRMDHFIVYVSSITASALWELDQLDTDERRRRVTVVFDEEAIHNKEIPLGFQQKMQDGQQKLIWSKQEPLPNLSIEQLKEQLSRKFLLTTPDEFTSNIEDHRRRISQSSARLPPGERETWLDFQFYPAVDADKLCELRQFSDWVQTHIHSATAESGITCLPLFLNQLQMRIFITLLLGEHDNTGRALAAYHAVMRGAFEYYSPPGEKLGGLSQQGRERNLGLLEEHSDLSRYSGLRLLAYGKSHEFVDLSARATTEFEAILNTTKAAVDKFFKTATARHTACTGWPE